MVLKIVQFLALVLTALALVPAGAQSRCPSCSLRSDLNRRHKAGFVNSAVQVNSQIHSKGRGKLTCDAISATPLKAR